MVAFSRASEVYMKPTICFILSRISISCCSILWISTSMSCLMFFTKFSIRIQRIHNFQAVAAKPAKSLNSKLQLPCRDNVVNTKNDKMKNLSE